MKETMDIIEFIRKTTDITLLPYQEDLIRKMVKGDTVMITTRGVSKTTLARALDEYMQYRKLEGAK